MRTSVRLAIILVVMLPCLLISAAAFAAESEGDDAESFSFANAARLISQPESQDFQPGNAAFANSNVYDGGLDYLFIGRAGSGYYSVPGETRVGGTYGGDFALQLTGNWGALLSANTSHVSGGTQFVGTLGIVKTPDPFGPGWGGPFSASIYFDQFTDSRISRLYLSQLRMQLGYALSDNLEFGIMYTEPTNQDGALFFAPLFGGFFPGTLRSSQNISGYVAGRIDIWQGWLTAGHRRPDDSFVVATGLQVPLTQRTDFFVNLNYESVRPNWGTSVGLEFRFGPLGGGRSSGGGSNYDYYAMTGEPLIIRAQNAPLTPKIESGGPGENIINRQQLAGRPTSFAQPEWWTDRYYNWVGRPMTYWAPQRQYGNFAGTQGNAGLNPFELRIGPGLQRVQKGL